MEAESSSEPAPVCWHVYLVRCQDGSLYTGIATDVERRFGEHELGRGAKYLRGRGPLSLELSHAIGERGLALRVEASIKRFSRAEKERLVAGARVLDELVAELRSS